MTGGAASLDTGRPVPPELRELMYASPFEPQVDSLVVRLFHEL